jgi:hypothetical protein
MTLRKSLDHFKRLERLGYEVTLTPEKAAA